MLATLATLATWATWCHPAWSSWSHPPRHPPSRRSSPCPPLRSQPERRSAYATVPLSCRCLRSQGRCPRPRLTKLVDPLPSLLKPHARYAPSGWEKRPTLCSKSPFFVKGLPPSAARPDRGTLVGV